MTSNFYQLYLSLRFNWHAYKTPPVPLIGTTVENLVFANLVLMGSLYSEKKFYRELGKLTGRDFH